MQLLPLIALWSVAEATVIHSNNKVALQAKSTPGALRRRSIDPVNVPLKDYFNGTDLQWVILRRWSFLVTEFWAGGLGRSQVREKLMLRLISHLPSIVCSRDTCAESHGRFRYRFLWFGNFKYVSSSSVQYISLYTFQVLCVGRLVAIRNSLIRLRARLLLRAKASAI